MNPVLFRSILSIFFFAVLPVFSRDALLTVQGDQVLVDGQPFRMWGIRVASATKDQSLTDHLIGQLVSCLGNIFTNVRLACQCLTSPMNLLQNALSAGLPDIARRMQICVDLVLPIGLQQHHNGTRLSLASLGVGAKKRATGARK